MSKKVLLLQGPVGGFFRRLQRDLERSGISVHRIVFNGGDFYYSIGSKFEIFRGTLADLENRLETIAADWQPNAIVLFGDERPIHRVAREVGGDKGIAIWSFEEGYIRPNYVSFERDGNNANSPLASSFDPARTVRRPPAAPAVLGSTKKLFVAAVVYFTFMRLTRRLFPAYAHHRDRRLRNEVRYWIRSLWRRARHASEGSKKIAALVRPDHPPYFVVALQVHDDLQLRAHGRGWRTRPFLRMVLASFARHAPSNVQLIVKAHPLDAGYGHEQKNLAVMVRESGLLGRVSFLHSGTMMPIIRNARGMVTINSTAGIMALQSGIPTIAFGKALYHQEGLSARPESHEDLDRFWAAPTPVDRAAATRFAWHLTQTGLLQGSFYVRASWPLMTQGIIARLSNDPDEAVSSIGTISGSSSHIVASRGIAFEARGVAVGCNVD